MNQSEKDQHMGTRKTMILVREFLKAFVLMSFFIYELPLINEC
jgi:hypothetical protein